MHKNTTLTLAIIFIALVTVFALVPTNTGFAFTNNTTIVLTSVMQEAEPITHYRVSGSQLTSVDPQRVSDTGGIEASEQLFLGLTDTDPTTSASIRPELATAWEVNEDGTQWTFTIRDDVPWVHWDPVTNEGEILRYVTAGDIAYGIKRSCDPRLGSYYTSVADKVILGCDEVSTKAVEEVTDADYDLVQVEAPDDTTLVVNLQFSAGYFFSQTPMWMYRPVPREVIEEYGDDWTEVGNLVTNGPFVLVEWARGVRRVMLRNPYLPDDLQGPGNIERIVWSVVPDLGTVFALYEAGQIDQSPVPAAELQSVLNDPVYAEQLFQTTSLQVTFFGFDFSKPPFDDVAVRRAFAAVVDRSAFVQEVNQGRGVPMIHFTPPGTFGAPSINEVGVGYDPAFAREQMEAAGYPNCEGFPDVNILVIMYLDPWAEFLTAAAERELGCDPNLFTLEQQEWPVFVETINPRNTSEDRPNIWTLAWTPDYPDANNWVGDVLACDGPNNVHRSCSEVDDLIDQAARENDAETRIELYYRIEAAFFGEDGEYPIIPLYLVIDYTLTKPWYTGPFETDSLFGGPHYDWYSIDQEAQLAAR